MSVTTERWFKCTNNRSNKYWRLSVVGKVVFTGWGQIGTAGSGKSYPCTSNFVAVQKSIKMCRQKLKRGYVEVFNTVDQAKLFGSTSAERQQAALLASDGTRKQRDKARREATSKLPNKEVAQAQFLTEMKILEAIQAQEDAKSKMKTEASKTSKAKPKPSIGSMFVVPKRKVII